MMNFDLMDTVAGKEIYDIGVLDTARANVVEILEDRFEIISESIIEKVNKINRKDRLSVLLKKAAKYEDMDVFNETLLKALQ